MNEREKLYFNAQEVAGMLGVSRGKAYDILRQMNAELKKQGYLTIAGRIPVEYFNEKCYRATKVNNVKEAC